MAVRRSIVIDGDEALRFADGDLGTSNDAAWIRSKVDIFGSVRPTVVLYWTNRSPKGGIGSAYG